jgi:hypothetical protein
VRIASRNFFRRTLTPEECYWCYPGIERLNVLLQGKTFRIETVFPGPGVCSAFIRYWEEPFEGDGSETFRYWISGSEPELP